MTGCMETGGGGCLLLAEFVGFGLSAGTCGDGLRARGSSTLGTFTLFWGVGDLDRFVGVLPAWEEEEVGWGLGGGGGGGESSPSRCFSFAEYKSST